VRLAQPIDLRSAQTPLPDQAIQVGLSAVTIEKITYWVPKNSLNVATPPVELYVASQSAKDETDPSAAHLGTVAPLPAGSTVCKDAADSDDLATKAGLQACKVTLKGAGQEALSQFVKNFRQAPFQLIIKATVEVTAGQPIPGGTLGVVVRPRAVLSVL
jgi:hypothetical protein